MKNKKMIFGIGFPKTATNSITRAMEDLGFKSKHYIGYNNFYEKIKKYEFVSDVPVSTRFEELDKLYPNSKFILTVREINSWLDSCKNWFKYPKNGNMGKLREELFGTNVWNEEKFINSYKRHYKKVRNLFNGREEDLLIIDIIGGENPKKLTNFLNKNKSIKFKLVNKGKYKQKNYLHKIQMDYNEINTIRKHLRSTDVMLEWGSGGSTWYFPLFVKKYYSIEHDEYWYNKVKEKTIFNVDLNLVNPNIPKKRCYNRNEYKDYIEKVNDLGVKKFDKVLIDGRGRKFCAVEVLPYLKKDSLVFIHDWKRKRYHSVLKYYDVIESTKRRRKIVVLKKK